MEKVITLLIEGKVGDALVSSTPLLYTIVIAAVVAIFIYIIMRYVVSPLITRRDAHELSRTLATMSNQLNDVLKQLHGSEVLLSHLYLSVLNEQFPSKDMIVWLSDSMGKLFPTLVVENLMRRYGTHESLNEERIKISVRASLREINDYMTAFPYSPLNAVRDMLEESADTITERFMKSVNLAELDGIDEQCILRCLFTLKDLAANQSSDVANYLKTSLDIALLKAANPRV